MLIFQPHDADLGKQSSVVGASAKVLKSSLRAPDASAYSSFHAGNPSSPYLCGKRLISPEETFSGIFRESNTWATEEDIWHPRGVFGDQW